jgi:hypothetical protein
MLYEWRIKSEIQAHVRRISPTKIGVFVDTIGKEHEESLVNPNELLQSLPFKHEVLMFMTPFTQFYSSQKQTHFFQPVTYSASTAYEPSHPMWTFSALYSVLVVRRLSEADVERSSAPRHATPKPAPTNATTAECDSNLTQATAPHHAATSAATTFKALRIRLQADTKPAEDRVCAPVLVSPESTYSVSTPTLFSPTNLNAENLVSPHKQAYAPTSPACQLRFLK